MHVAGLVLGAVAIGVQDGVRGRLADGEVDLQQDSALAPNSLAMSPTACRMSATWEARAG